MITVRDVLAHKGTDVVTVSPDSTVFEALEVMSAKNIGAVLIVGAKGEVAGILSERDYARKVILLGKSSRDTRVSEIMSKQVVFIAPQNTVEEAMAVMTEKRCRHLPVIENGTLGGIISIGDVVQAIIRNKDFEISQLERYITGSL